PLGARRAAGGGPRRRPSARLAGGLRAIVTGEREVERAEDAFAGAIVDVVGGEGGFLFRDALGTVAGIATFLGSLGRARSRGPALVNRSRSGFSVTFGGPPLRIGAP